MQSPLVVLMVVKILLVCALFARIFAASCSSNEYCPNGWTILRKEDLTPHTCDPMKYQTKCPKPHQCVHSKCGMSFCCANPESMRRWKREKELEEDMANDADDEL